MQIKSKNQFNELYQRGLFGNKLRTWNSLSEFYGDNYQGYVTMRYRGGAGGAFAAFRVASSEVPRVAAEWIRKGADSERINLNESAPDDQLLLQGEVQLLPSGLYFRYCDKPGLNMRDAMRQAVDVAGIEAKFLLQRHLTAASYTDLLALQECYPDSVIEIGIYRQPVGELPSRNMIVWEVRNY